MLTRIIINEKSYSLNDIEYVEKNFDNLVVRLNLEDEREDPFEVVDIKLGEKIFNVVSKHKQFFPYQNLLINLELVSDFKYNKLIIDNGTSHREEGKMPVITFKDGNFLMIKDENKAFENAYKNFKPDKTIDM